jgi:DNA-binding SARP family transcriptional activator
MRHTEHHGEPDNNIETVLELEQAVQCGQLPEWDKLSRLPESVLFRSPFLLRAGAVRLMLDGRLREARNWAQAAVKAFAVLADHREMLSMIGLLSLIHVRIGDFSDNEAMLMHLDAEAGRDPDLCGGYVWWALARGKCWSRTTAFLAPRLIEDDFARAADRFREDGDAIGFAYVLLDRWIYDPSGMKKGAWVGRIAELGRWAALRPECAAVHEALTGGTDAGLTARYAYMLRSLQSGDADNGVGSPEGELRYDVEVQMFACRLNVARRLAEGERTDAAVALRQLELLHEEMSTPRTLAWVADYKGKLGLAAVHAPIVRADEPPDAPAEERTHRMRIQLMSGIRIFLPDGTALQPKWKRRKSRELFVYLLLQQDYRALRNQVMEHLFGEPESSRVANHLYVSLHELRSALAGIGFEDAIEVRGGLVGFRESVVDMVDVEQYVTQSRVGDQLWAADRDAAVMLYMDAVRQYGLLGSDMPVSDWLERWRIQLLERQTVMLRRLAEYYIALAEDSHAEQWLTAWIDLRPDQEEAYQAMIRFWKERGRHAEAVGWYKRLERVFREEYGLEPLEETKRLVWES